MNIMDSQKNCNLCPRKCNVNRLEGFLGYCKSKAALKVSKAMLHKWEEPCISNNNGSGAVFFSGCNLSCVFCQNFNISQEGIGKEISIQRLAQIFLELQNNGAENINLVSPTHFVPQIIMAINIAKGNGLNLPIIYNSNGYENVETLKMLDGIIDIYLPDIKYFSDKYALKYSNAPNYFKYASLAVKEMYRQVGSPIFHNNKIKKGLIIRHLLLPNMLFEAKKIIDYLSENIPHDVYISLMSQYTPMYKANSFKEINKKVSPDSYEWLIDYVLSKGFENGYIQDYTSAEYIYTPKFDLEGI